jgi:polyisoprenoid-binding protein YceI
LRQLDRPQPRAHPGACRNGDRRMNARHAAAAIALAATLGGTAWAQGSPDPLKVQPGTYAVDPDHTQVLWAVNHLGFSEYQGRFDKASGSLTLNPHALAQTRLEVSVQIDSVSTPSAKLNGELTSSDWFDAAKYPTMTFKSTKVEPTGPTTAKVTGDLTLHGVTKPVTFDASFIGAGLNPVAKVYDVGFQATGSIKRSDFGVRTYLPVISDEVALTLNGAFAKQ